MGSGAFGSGIKGPRVAGLRALKWCFGKVCWSIVGSVSIIREWGERKGVSLWFVRVPKRVIVDIQISKSGDSFKGSSDDGLPTAYL